MKKALMLFIFFFIIDILLLMVLLNFNGGKDFIVLFFPAMFLEISIYGSFIIYDISNKDK